MYGVSDRMGRKFKHEGMGCGRGRLSAARQIYQVPTVPRGLGDLAGTPEPWLFFGGGKKTTIATSM